MGFGIISCFRHHWGSLNISPWVGEYYSYLGKIDIVILEVLELPSMKAKTQDVCVSLLVLSLTEKKVKNKNEYIYNI